MKLVALLSFLVFACACKLIPMPNDQVLHSGITEVDGVGSFLSAAIQTLHVIPKFRHELARLVNATKAPATSLAYSLNMVFESLEKGKPVSEALVIDVSGKIAAKHPEVANGNSLRTLRTMHPLYAGLMIIADITNELNAITPSIADPLEEMFKVKTTSEETLGINLKMMYPVDVADPTSKITFDELFNLSYGSHVNTKKVFIFDSPKTLSELPPYLLINLPRFDSTGTRIKNQMSIPLQTSFRDYMANPTASKYNYELIGMGFISSGETFKTGHYKSLTKQSDGKWYIIDNLNIYPATSINEQKTFESSQVAYVLYRATSEYPFQNTVALPPVRSTVPKTVIPTPVNTETPNRTRVPPVTRPTVSHTPTKQSSPAAPRTGGSGRSSGGSGNSNKSANPVPAPVKAVAASQPIPSGATSVVSFKAFPLVITAFCILLSI